MQREPATVISAVTALITAVVTLLVIVGIDVSSETQNALIAAAGAFITVILMVGPIIRQFVFSPNTVENKVGEALVASPGTTTVAEIME